MGPPARRLASRRSSGKAVSEMADPQRSDPPVGRDCGERFKDEAPAPELGVWNGQSARAEFAPAPQRNVEIEDARSPAPARAAAELAFDGLQSPQHIRGLQVAFDQGDRIGEIPARGPMGLAHDDPRGVEQAEFLIEPGDCLLDDVRRGAEAPVPPVRPDRNGVEVAHKRALSLRAERSNPGCAIWIASSLRSSQ